MTPRRAGRTGESAEGTLPGVIDTLGVAFIRLIQRPYVILPPLLLDLFLWLGISLPATPVVATLERQLRGWGTSGADAANQLHSAGSGFNLFDLLGVAMPSLVQGLSSNTVVGARDSSIAAWGWVSTLLAAIALLALGVVFFVAYLTLVGVLVRDGSLDLRVLLARTLKNLRNTVGFVVVAIGIALLLLLPLLTVSGILFAVGLDILPLLLMVILLAGFTAIVFLYFAQDAIVVSDAGPLRSIYLSVNVVRSHLWATARFIAISSVISSGMPVALSVFAHSPYSLPFALVVHAFIATGLAAAAMLFFQDRARLLVTPGVDTDPSRNAALS